MRGVLTHGDGITVYAVMPDCCIIDLPGFEHLAFTPYAVYDPPHGRRFQERTGSGHSSENWTDIQRAEYEAALNFYSTNDLSSVLNDRYRVVIGDRESLAVAFKRKQQRIALLHRLAGGTDVNEFEYRAARMWKHAAGGGNRGHRVFDVFRPNSLQWKTASADDWDDFPKYLQATFLHLDRVTAWRLAWALVRAAYLDRWPDVDALLAGAAKESREKAKTFDTFLNEVIIQLEGRSLT